MNTPKLKSSMKKLSLLMQSSPSLLLSLSSLHSVTTDRASTRVNPATVNLDDISEQDEVSGIVVRVSNYGVFIDIGAGVDAFLHRRKMKVTTAR